MRIGRIQEFLEDSSAVKKKEREDLLQHRRDFVSRVNILNRGRFGASQDLILAIKADIKKEEAGFGEWKRTKARECMGILFGGLLECSEKGTIVATLGLATIGNLSTGTIQPGIPPGHYSGKSLIEQKVEAEQPPNEDRTGGIPSHSPPPRVPPKVPSKLGTSMGGQKTGSTSTRSQDPHLAQPVSQHLRWI